MYGWAHTIAPPIWICRADMSKRYIGMGPDRFAAEGWVQTNVLPSRAEMTGRDIGMGPTAGAAELNCWVRNNTTMIQELRMSFLRNPAMQGLLKGICSYKNRRSSSTSPAPELETPVAELQMKWY
ncbi:hypothetical protein C8R48DRAFT_673803 [Suillus tomentosus]|nr:hypothetical protein C8R48DRAFT_673803 [Suillus tomentosus]